MSEHLFYTALGDSLTVGVGATLFAPNFVRQYRRHLEQALQRPARLRVFAKNGATSEAVLESLSHPEVAYAVGSANAITLTAGGNDFIQAGRVWTASGDSSVIQITLASCYRRIEQIIETIYHLHRENPEPFMIRVLNLYNPMPQMPQSSPILETFNRRLAGLERFPGVKVADIYHAFYGREASLLSFDHIHPNPIGYSIMADTTARLGFDPLINYR
ncbi:lysophospholipase [Sporolactobacillus sp. THM7-4]|nr:lysophospholipase [Sporolactobacillus sp. THM7-4]